MQHDGTHQHDGTGNQGDTDDVSDGIGEHNAVEQIIFLPLFLFAKVSTVDTGSHSGVGGNESQCRAEGTFRDLKAEQSFGKPLRFRAADTHQRGIECHDHQDDAEGNDLFDLGIDVLGKVHVHHDRDHDGGADLPVDAKDEVHTGTGAGDVAHREEHAGKEYGTAHDAGSHRAVILADGVDGRHPGHDGQTVGDHHKGDAHENDGEEQPHQVVSIVCADHRGRCHGTGADHDACRDQTGANALEQVFQWQTLHV